MYFELAMMFATPSLFVGLSIVFELKIHIWRPGAAAIIFGIIALGSGYYFHKWAKDSHEVLCRTRRQINDRLDKAGTSGNP
jgi:hypothetical protein